MNWPAGPGLPLNGRIMRVSRIACLLDSLKRILAALDLPCGTPDELTFSRHVLEATALAAAFDRGLPASRSICRCKRKPAVAPH